MKQERAADRLLSCLSNPVRLDIVRSLTKESLLSFTDLMRRLGLDVKVDTGRFGYHLRRLIDEGVVRLNPSAKKYELTELGRHIADLISTLEDTAGGARSLVVRTSRLQMEPFNRNKIAEALEREANVPRRLAADIAREAEERILRLNVKYLTAPLIRELVNTILIERGFEDYRHSLTRLGLPVHDVANLVKFSSRLSCPEYLYRRAGEAILAEYTLLKVLPRHVADAHLSGSIHVCDLPGWALRVGSLHHDLRALLRLSRLSFTKEVRLGRVLRAIVKLLRAFESHIGVGQGVEFFNVILAPFVRGLSLEEVKEELSYFINELNWAYGYRRHLGPAASLGIEFTIPRGLSALESPQGDLYGEYEEEAQLIVEALLNLLMEGSPEGGVYVTPQVIVALRSLHLSSRAEELFRKAHEACARWGIPCFVNLTVGWQGEGASYSALFSRLGSEWRGDWELDTLRAGCMGEVAVNVPRLAYEAGGSDELFMEGLWDRVETAVNAFLVKRDSIAEGLSEGLLPMLSSPFEDGYYLRLDACSFNVSMVGLPEAVKAHTGEYPHESRLASSFAVKVLRSLETYLNKLSGETGLRLLASVAPCEDPSARFALADTKRFDKFKLVFQGSREKPYYTVNQPSVRSTYMPLKRRAKLEGVFHSLTLGGHVMLLGIGDVALEDLTILTRRLFEEYGVGALAYDKALTSCSSCQRIFNGLKTRCPSCGASGRTITYYGRSSPLYKPSVLWSPEERDSITRAYRYEL